MKNYRKLVPLVLIIILAASWYLLINETYKESKEYETYLAEARKWAEDGITKYAMENYNKALEIESSVELYIEIAEYYKEKGKEDDYLDWCVKFFETYPTEPRAYDALVAAYMKESNYESCYNTLFVAQRRGISTEYMDSVWKEIAYEYKLDISTYDNVGVYSNNYCAVQKKGTWGFVDRYGNQRVNCTYSEVGSFTKSNFAPVINKKGESYYIDKTGAKVVVMDESYAKLGLYIEGIISAKKKNGKYTYVDMDGKSLFGNYDYASTINGGVGAIKEGKKWYIIDQQGNKLVNTAYEDIKLDEKEIAYRNERLFVKLNDKYIMVDSLGNQIGSGKYEDAKVFSSEQYAAVKINGNWSFVDKDGNVVSKQKYEDARSFINGFAAVKQHGKWGFINEDEELVIKTKFYDVKDFNEKGSCFVNTGNKWQLLKLYRLNREG